MVVDSMSKYEVMDNFRNDFDSEVKPYYDNVLKKRIQPLIRTKAQREKTVITLGWERNFVKQCNYPVRVLRKMKSNGICTITMTVYILASEKWTRR